MNDAPEKIGVCGYCDKVVYAKATDDCCYHDNAMFKRTHNRFQISEAQLAKANERVAELEGLLKRVYGDYPCEHDPENDPHDNPKCKYCSLFWK